MFSFDNNFFQWTLTVRIFLSATRGLGILILVFGNIHSLHSHQKYIFINFFFRKCNMCYVGKNIILPSRTISVFLFDIEMHKFPVVFLFLFMWMWNIKCCLLSSQFNQKNILVELKCSALSLKVYWYRSEPFFFHNLKKKKKLLRWEFENWPASMDILNE